jgi:hypothetical protein
MTHRSQELARRCLDRQLGDEVANRTEPDQQVVAMVTVAENGIEACQVA